MHKGLCAVLEHPVPGAEGGTGESLARVVEAHPELSPLLDYSWADPAQIAREIGMIYPYEEDAEEDLADLGLDPPEWFEPAAGLAAVRAALRAVREDPAGIARAIYDPGLRPDAVIADLEAIERILLLAQQHETRFHFAVTP